MILPSAVAALVSYNKVECLLGCRYLAAIRIMYPLMELLMRHCHVAGFKLLTKLDLCSPKENRQKDLFDGLFYGMILILNYYNRILMANVVQQEKRKEIPFCK